MLLTITSTAPRGLTRPTSGSCCTSTPTGRSVRPRVGTAHVFYPEATAERCTAALLLEVDPVALVARQGRPRRRRIRARRSTSTTARTPRRRCWPWRWARCSARAMAGRCEARPELAAQPLPLEIARPGAARAAAAPTWSQRLFEPLGWTVDAEPVAAGRASSRVGRLARTCDLRLTGDVRARRRAAPPVRAAAGARRRQALLGRARRGRQAAARRRGLARRPPGAGADHPPLPARTGASLRRASAGRRGSPRSTTRRRDARQRGARRAPTAEASARRRSPSSGARRSSPRCAAAGAAACVDLGCGEGALLRALLGGPARSPRSSASTCRRARSRSPRGGCAWTACPSGSARRLDAAPVLADLPRQAAARATTPRC